MSNECDRDENLLDDIEAVTLDPNLVAKFLTKCEGGLPGDDTEPDSQMLFPTEVRTAPKVFTSTLKRPSFYQKTIDLGSLISVQPNLEVVEPVKYVSEIHVTIGDESQLEHEANVTGSTTEMPITPPAQTQEQVEETPPISDVMARIRKEKSAALITNFLTKFTQESTPSFRSPGTQFTKQLASTVTTNESLLPSTSDCLSPNECSSPTKTTMFSSTEVSSGVFIREDVSMTSSTSQTLSKFEYTDGDVLPNPVTTTSVITQDNSPISSLTNQNTSTFNHNIDSKVNTQIDSSSNEISSFPLSETTHPSDDDLPPPLPDQPPPLPNQPPPPLLMSGHMVQSITPEEADFITVYLKSLRTGGTETATTTSISSIPESDTPLPTEHHSKHQVVNTKQPNKHIRTQTTITSVVTKQAPKMIRSPALPVWPPPPTEARSKPLKSSTSESSSGDSQWEDAEDGVELREQVCRESEKEASDKTNSFGKNGSATASWDTGYSGSNTSSQISWILPDPETSPAINVDPATGVEEGKEKHEDDKGVLPQRLSILELLRINSEAGRKSKPRWNKSVDSDAVLEGLSEKQLQLFELGFEMITTEAEYFSRVEFLKKNFLVPNLRYNKKDTLSSDSKKNIFLDLDEVCGCSEKLLADLDRCWQKSVYLIGIFDVVKEHSKANITAFINYCAEYEGVIEKIAVLRKEDRKFEEVVSGLEDGKPDLSEQLKEPMNRIIQLNLLLKNCLAVMTQLSKTDESKSFAKEFESCRSATESVAQLCSKVDEVTGMRRRVQKIIEIQESLEFPLQMTQLSLASQNRWFVKKGTLTQNGYLILNTGKKPGFKKSNSVVTIFLFNDLIILAKKKSEECHVVKDYGQRPGVQMSLTQGMEALPRRLVEDSPGYYTLFLTIEKNHMGGKSHMFLSCPLVAERDSWLDAMKRTSDEFHGL